MAVIGAGGARKPGIKPVGGEPENGGGFTPRGIPLRGKNRMGVQHMTDQVRNFAGPLVGLPRSVKSV